MILALDLATKTGFSYRSLTGRIEYGEQDFSLKRGDSPGMRYVRFNAWLREMLDFLRPDIVVYEQAHNRGGAPTEVLNGLTTRVQEAVALRENCEHQSVHSGTLKKFATGNGRASKEDMVAFAAAVTTGESYTNITDNEADAIALLLYAENSLGAEAL